MAPLIVVAALVVHRKVVVVVGVPRWIAVCGGESRVVVVDDDVVDP